MVDIENSSPRADSLVPKKTPGEEHCNSAVSTMCVNSYQCKELKEVKTQTSHILLGVQQATTYVSACLPTCFQNY